MCMPQSLEFDGDEIHRTPPASKEEHKEDQVEKEAAECGLSVEQFEQMLAIEAENAATKVRIPRLTSCVASWTCVETLEP